MKIVQEQRLQLKMKFLLGYNKMLFSHSVHPPPLNLNFSWWKGMTKLSANGGSPHHPLSRENHACCNNLVL